MNWIRKNRQFACAALAAGGLATTGQAVDKFVDANTLVVDGSGDSWLTPYRHLQDAIAETSNGDRISVAGGNYYADLSDDGNATEDDQSAFFDMRLGVTILGGFAGSANPTFPGTRDIDLYVTTLSGDLDGDDSPGFLNRDFNSYHVVKSSNVPSLTVTRIDGVTISGGNAVGTPPPIDDVGGGVRGIESNFAIVRCTITDNSADNGGGVFSGDTLQPSPVGQDRIRIINSHVTANRANFSGGGMMNFGLASTLWILNSIVDYNEALGVGTEDGGGGLKVEDGVTVEVYNSVLANNHATGRGGGLLSISHGAVVVKGELVNSVVWENSADDVTGTGVGEQVAWTTGAGTILWVEAYNCFVRGMGELGFDNGGSSNIDDGDPMEPVDPGLDPITYHLLAGSVLVNEGRNPEPGDALFDLNAVVDSFDLDDDQDTTEMTPARGQVRRVYGLDENGFPVIDIGAFEVLGCASAADVDGDAEVSFSDLIAVLADWGPCGGCPTDIDNDGQTGFADLIQVLANWCSDDGESTSAPGSVLDCLSQTSNPSKQAACIEAMLLSGTP